MKELVLVVRRAAGDASRCRDNVRALPCLPLPFLTLKRVLLPLYLSPKKLNFVRSGSGLAEIQEEGDGRDEKRAACDEVACFHR